MYEEFGTYYYLNIIIKNHTKTYLITSPKRVIFQYQKAANKWTLSSFAKILIVEGWIDSGVSFQSE